MLWWGRGWPDEDPKAGLIDTYREEGGKKEGKMDDESWTKDT
jgi:monolysocardiolipin acyltransferase